MGVFAAAAAPFNAIASAIPGKMETMYRKDIKADRARLASGGGGMTAGQRGTLQSEAMNQIQAQQAATTANLARGSSMGGGESGQRDQAVLASQKAAEGAGNQAMSDIRGQDLTLAESQRQQLYARMAQARAWGQQRKQEALGQVQQGAQGLDSVGTPFGKADKAGATKVLEPPP